jgi:hypothetical protein
MAAEYSIQMSQARKFNPGALIISLLMVAAIAATASFLPFRKYRVGTILYKSHLLIRQTGYLARFGLACM